MSDLLFEFVRFAARSLPGLPKLLAEFANLKGLGVPPDLAAWADVDRRIDEELKKADA